MIMIPWKRAGTFALALTLAAGAGYGLARGADNEPVKVAPGKSPGEAHEKARPALKDLGLTSEQKEKLKPLLKEQRDKMRALREDTKSSRAEKAAKVKALQDEMAPKLKEVLTAEQYDKLIHRRQEHREVIKKKLHQQKA